ncbi:hypothetical protein [Burkholderia sp. BCC1644]|uniref:hypothetical protein n=1 Tax=Burkholderia sp. BCC1644 TaxID=2676293 RepID=UPI001591F176|nr:hypothetical protein [Burkholderia sp. BCC1644]
MKKQCGHVRKNDVFALIDPEENAGESTEIVRPASRCGVVSRVLPSLTKKRRTAKGAE